jgi:multidrug transporter EmrE-like cation transporter
MLTLCIAILSVSFSVLAQYLLKAGVQTAPLGEISNLHLLAKNWRIWAGFACYSTAALIWLRVLADWDVSKAYPMMGIGFVLALLVGLLYGETITMGRILGVLAIFIGVILVARS